nr:MAG: E6 protein [Leptonychotes weddellii papillomavirus 13]
MEYPKSVQGLLNTFELSLSDLNLCCVWCVRTLSRRELILFDYKDLCLVWRKGIPFGVCDPCLRGAAKVNLWRHFDRSVYISTLEDELNTAIGDLKIRCAGCYKPLAPEEKLLMVEEGRRVHCIGEQWRGVCIGCRRGFRR